MLPAQARLDVGSVLAVLWEGATGSRGLWSYGSAISWQSPLSQPPWACGLYTLNEYPRTPVRGNGAKGIGIAGITVVTV